jgi:CPA2 family monovalent cation:H+ antiporter-2
MHDIPLITTIAAAFTMAWLLGLLTQRLGLSPIIGYLVAGVLIGPYTPGFEGDVEIANQLAEVGVILLMFGVGLHFHLSDLLAVRSVAIPGAVGQSLTATGLSIVVFSALGLPLSNGAVIGMALAVASTVVLMRVLMDADMLHSTPGHVAVGWLLVEDIFTVVVLVLIPVLGTDHGSGAAGSSSMGLGASVGLALLKLVILVAVMGIVGSRVIPWALVQVARLRSRELFTLTVLVFSIATAAASYTFFGASMALGAFLAGMVVAQSPVSQQAAADALPMRDAFAVIFFVSVGMLFDPAFVLQEPLMILAALSVVLLAKPLAALVIVAALGHSARTALTVALGLAQIGEFSFILSAVAREHGLMPDYGHNVLVASAMISITLNPIIFRWSLPIEEWLRRRPRLWSLVNGRAERRAMSVNVATENEVARRVENHERLAIVVGFGPVGRSVHRLLNDAGLTTVVIDMNMETIAQLERQGFLAVFGDATHESILEQAGMRHASHLILTLPHSSARRAVVIAARNLNSESRILVRAHYLSERDDLDEVGATAAVFEEAEVAIALARLVLFDTGTQRELMKQKIRDLRTQLFLENMSHIQDLRVRSVMVPWSRVRRLTNATKLSDVRRQVAKLHFSRFPVTDSTSGKIIGYLLAKDLIADPSEDGNWLRLVRPLRAVGADDNIESTLHQMQGDGTTICLVEDAGVPVGLITLEDILEQVVGRIEDEYPREEFVAVRDAILAGGIVLDLQSRTPQEAISELAAAVPRGKLPPDVEIDQLAIQRERAISTDLGVGVAIPHARCPELTVPLIVFGRSLEGIPFSTDAAEPVRLLFLVVTPLDQPDIQLSLLGQLARLSGDELIRERLHSASTTLEVLEALDAQPVAGRSRQHT